MPAFEKKTNPFVAPVVRPVIEAEAPVGEMGRLMDSYKERIAHLSEEELFAAFGDMLSAGSEHLVFDLYREPDPQMQKGLKQHPQELKSPLLLKINYSETDALIHQYLLQKRPLAWMKAEARANLRSEMQRREAQLSWLRKYFNTPKHQAVPYTKHMVVDLPLTRDLVKEAGEQISETLKSKQAFASEIGKLPEQFAFPALACLQRRLRFFGESFSLGGGRLEDIAFEENEPEAYAEAHWQALDIPSKDMTQGQRDDEYFDGYPEMDGIVKRAATDPVFKKTLGDLTRRMIAFVKETGLPLDVVGSDNVIINLTDKGWKPYFIDALPIAGGNMVYLTRAIDQLETLGDFKLKTLASHFTKQEAGAAIFALNSVRCLNVLAQIAGIKERLRLEGLEDIPALAWKNLDRV